MAYKKVQFIAHCIHTGPQAVLGGGQTYLGLAQPEDDIAARGGLVKAAIAVAEGKAAGDADTLKVFMMPEFFFRGATGAYEMEDVQSVVSELQATVKDAKFKDWLFVFGTIVGTSQGAQPGFWARLFGVQQKLEGYNYALVQRGGADAGPDTAYAVVKEHKSGIDFIVRANLPPGIFAIADESIEHLKPLSGGPRDETQRFSYDGAGVFQIKQAATDTVALKIGVEICLDYIAGRLASANPRPSVDLHLVPSCGATLENHGPNGWTLQNNAVCRDGGYVFNCDGMSNYAAPATPYASDLRKRTGTTYAAIAAAVPPEAIPYQPAPQLFVGGAGVVRLYPVQVLP